MTVPRAAHPSGDRSPEILMPSALPPARPATVRPTRSVGSVVRRAVRALAGRRRGERSERGQILVIFTLAAVAIIAGAVLLGEPVTEWTIVGFVLVKAGSWLVTWRGRQRLAEPAPVPIVAPVAGSDPSG